MEENLHREILIIAGETSGDLHAAPVASEILSRIPDVRLFGAGGDRMCAAGVDLLADAREMAVLGFSDVPRVLPLLKRLKRTVLQRVQERGVKLAILVDYPGFNLNIARALKRLPHPPKILYYIAPQVWAWRAGRAKQMAKFIDAIAVVFPFEVDIFQSVGLPVKFVGHPLLEELKLPNPADLNVKIKYGQNIRLALLPGSRRQEVNRHLPVMLKAFGELRRKYADLKALIGKAPHIEAGFYQPFLTGISSVEMASDSRELLASADLAAVCSGTTTLEAALFGVPQVVVYRTSALNYLLAKYLVKLRNIALVNVTAGERLAEELLQNRLTPKNLSAELMNLLDEERRGRMIEGYQKVRHLLGESGAAGRVAELAVSMMGG